ncbi:MAG TPA: C40 family peptidase [Casimicrobiaceae bacterium]|nr:C40 family peptidase [Casimicrobiaceae bacterium]
MLAALAFCAPASGNEVDGRSIAETARDSAKVAASSVWRGAQDLATFALGLIGVSYRFGGSTPEQGLDCSGLIRYVFQQVTGVTLPRTARELSGMGKKVALADLQPGDLVFFNTRRFAFSHVGIYLGDNQFVHAPHRGSEVMVTQMSGYWQRRFNGARRLVGVVPSLVPSIAAELVSSASAQAPSAQTPDDLAPDDAGPAESTQAGIPADTPAQP